MSDDSLLPRVRSDLVYTEDASDPEYFYVKDPLRAQFSRFNELQVFMMQSLDGTITADDMVELIGEEFGSEVPISSITRFLTRLEREFLLDVSTYRMESEKDRRDVRAELRRRGLVWRSMGRESGDRELTPETLLFEEGIRQIEAGDPCQAVPYFQKVVALNPDNTRAVEVLTAIHRAFFGKHRELPDHLVMKKLWDPDEFLERLDRRIGKPLFSIWGLIGLAVLMTISVYPLADFEWPAISTFGWIDIAIAIALALLSLFLHELGHGLACKHYGGNVNDMGLLLFYGVAPGAYCDVSDTYLFKERSPKIIVSLAGIFVTLGFTSVLLLLYHYTSDAFALRNGMLIVVAVSILPILDNLVPLIKLDGYFALADYLDVRNLRERSFDYCKEALKRTLFGVYTPTEETEPTDREKRIFITYGVLAAIYSTATIYILWLTYLLPWAIDYLGVPGLILTIVYGFRLIMNLLIRPGRTFLTFLLSHRQTIFTVRRTTAFATWGVFLWLVATFAWPFHIDGEMKIEPGSKHVVRAKESGLLVELAVTEGDHVEPGQVIARLANPDLLRERDRMASVVAAAAADVRRLRAGPRSEEVAVAQSRQRMASVAAQSARVTMKKSEAMRAADVLTAADHAIAARNAGRRSSKVREAKFRLDLVRAGTQVDEIAAAEARLRGARVSLEDIERRLGLLVVKSELSGVVVGTDLHTLLQRLFTVGDTLLEIHHQDIAVAEIQVPPTELVHHLGIGQVVALRPYGDPHRLVETSVARRQPGTRGATVVLESKSFDNPGWPTGLTGHARIYGPPRSVAYQVIGVPLLRLFQYEGWKIFGSVVERFART